MKDIDTLTDRQVTLQPFCRTELFSLQFNLWHKLAVFAWLKPVTSSEYRQGMLWLNEYVRTNRMRYMLLNCSIAGAFKAENKGWAVEKLSGLLAASTVERLAQVSAPDANDAEALAEMQQRLHQLYPYKLNLAAFSDEAQAIAWLLQ